MSAPVQSRQPLASRRLAASPRGRATRPGPPAGEAEAAAPPEPGMQVDPHGGAPLDRHPDPLLDPADPDPADPGTRRELSPGARPGPADDDSPGEGHRASEHQPFRFLSGLMPAAPFLPPADLVIVDIETTGWLADAASITEIGAVRLSPGRPMAEFSALVNPGVPIPADITSLTGITDVMVSDAPAITDVLPGFLDFASGGVMVAHNAPFDMGFLAAACHDCGIDWPPCAVIDTAVLSRMLLSQAEVPDHRLVTLSSHFGAPTWPCHRALADAKATAAVLRGLLGLLGRGPRPTPGPLVYAPPRCPPAAAIPRVPVSQEAPSRYDVAAAGARVPGIQEAAMVTAIVLIKTDVASIPETAEAIAQIRHVSEVYSVTGEFDLVAMVRVRSHEELGDVIPGTVNKVPGVTHTETHIAFRTYSRHDLDAAFSLGYPESV